MKRIKTFYVFNERENYGINGCELSIKMGGREITGKVKSVENGQIILDYVNSENKPYQLHIVYDDGKFWNAKTSNMEILPVAKYDQMILDKIKS